MSIYIALSLLGFGLARYLLPGSFRRRVRHPPSIWSLPFVGHAFSIPPGLDHINFQEMGRKLDSDVVYLNLIGQPLVILNSARAASDLLDKRSSIYSDRIGAPMVTDPALLDWSRFVSMLPYNDAWRRQRRRITNHLNPRAARQFDGLQQDEARLLLGRLLNISASSNLYAEVKDQFIFTLGSTMFRAAYGYRLKSDRDPFYVNAVKASHNLVDAVMISNFLVNAFPILSRVPDWVPGTGWKRTVRKWRDQKNEAVDAPYEWAKQQIAGGDFEKSILSALLADDEVNSDLSATDREAELKELCYTLFVGGTDTTATALVNFVAAMVANPEAQTKAQAEIDAVIGYATRLPTLADEQQLPYLRNLTLEVLRWLPVGPTGLPHGCSQDDTYRGYDIQKGTIVTGNVWAMSRDEAVYQDADKFDPERFADPKTVPIPSFGWGRRKCPGVHFAEASLFLMISSLLTTFTFDRKKGTDGKEIAPKIEEDYNALTMTLKPFEFELRPRSERHRQLILDNMPSC